MPLLYLLHITQRYLKRDYILTGNKRMPTQVTLFSSNPLSGCCQRINTDKWQYILMPVISPPTDEKLAYKKGLYTKTVGFRDSLATFRLKAFPRILR